MYFFEPLPSHRCILWTIETVIVLVGFACQGDLCLYILRSCDECKCQNPKSVVMGFSHVLTDQSFLKKKEWFHAKNHRKYGGSTIRIFNLTFESVHTTLSKTCRLVLPRISLRSMFSNLPNCKYSLLTSALKGELQPKIIFCLLTNFSPKSEADQTSSSTSKRKCRKQRSEDRHFLAPLWPHEFLTSSTHPAPVSSCSKQEDQCVDRRVVNYDLVCGFWLLQW